MAGNFPAFAEKVVRIIRAWHGGIVRGGSRVEIITCGSVYHIAGRISSPRFGHHDEVTATPRQHTPPAIVALTIEESFPAQTLDVVSK